MLVLSEMGIVCTDTVSVIVLSEMGIVCTDTVSVIIAQHAVNMGRD